MKKLRMAVVALGAWVFLGAAYLALTPSPARASCNNGACQDPYHCVFTADSNCNLGPNWCAWAGCNQ
jgi:hypothetical protein